MRRISLNRYDATLYLDEFEDHCLTLKNAPHAILTCVAYETLVNEEDQACSTPDTPHTLITIRRISIKISPDKDPRLLIYMRRIQRSRYAASKDGVRIFQNILILDPTRS